MIKASVLAADMEQVLSVCPPYVSPGTTNWYDIIKGAGCDCSGVPCAIYRRHGLSLYHGSNTIARQYMETREKLTKTSQLQIGMAVFKWSDDGGQPSKYHADGLGNFHHFGVVTSVKPLRIVHQSSAAGHTACDTSIKKWQYCGCMKGVSYDEAPEPAPQPEGVNSMYTAKVNASTLMVREQPNTGSAILDKLHKGDTVECSELKNGWLKLDDRDGWISAAYCSITENKPNDADEKENDKDEKPSLEKRVADLEDTVAALIDAVELLKGDD